MDQVSITIQLDSSIGQALMEFCRQTGSTESNVINAALKDYLNRYAQKG